MWRAKSSQGKNVAVAGLESLIEMKRELQGPGPGRHQSTGGAQSMRPVRKFSAEYLEYCRSMSVDEIARFLEDFRVLHSDGGKSAATKSRLISMKVPEALLGAFKIKARLSGVPYQTQIKRLMTAWLEKA